MEKRPYTEIPIVDAARRCGLVLDDRTLRRSEVEASCPFCGDHGKGRQKREDWIIVEHMDATGRIKRIDDVTRTIIMVSGQQIPIDDIYQIESNNN